MPLRSRAEHHQSDLRPLVTDRCDRADHVVYAFVRQQPANIEQLGPSMNQTLQNL
ncbi:hypothetical protein [Kibdelosporangium philippinense]|uniref:hypothetical protein n=1 Tax=Kibdelosporangium philippinense TaxID=211113 RepID=UPI0036229E77